MANRVGPIPPEKQPEPSKQLPGQDTRVTPKGVEKVREIDPDEQRSRNRARQFQRALDDAEQRLDYAKNPVRAQTPFDAYREEQRTRSTPRARPEAPPPPEEENLPQSNQFWNKVDEPPDQPPPSQTFQEKPSSAAREKEKGEKGGLVGPKEGEKTPSFGAPGKSEKEKKLGEKKGGPAVPAKEEKKPTAPLKKGERKPEKEKEEWLAPETPPPSKQKKEAEKLRAAEAMQKAEQKKKEKVEIIPPSTQTLPANVAPMAQAAATQAAPYLSPEILPLFYQMVGMIHVMAAPPGVSRTEVVLNSPNFANSRFFGSTITIEKFATAPNAINIRLSGSNEAVTAFNQNLSKLAAAFDRANLPFQINRLEATYSRPVFRRKEPGEGRGEAGGGFKQRKGG